MEPNVAGPAEEMAVSLGILLTFDIETRTCNVDVIGNVGLSLATIGACFLMALMEKLAKLDNSPQDERLVNASALTSKTIDTVAALSRM